MSANVFDLDSVQLLQTVRLMRDEGKLLSGFEMKVRPNIFVGAAENPFAGPNVQLRAMRLAKKSGGRGRIHPDPVHL